MAINATVAGRSMSYSSAVSLTCDLGFVGPQSSLQRTYYCTHAIVNGSVVYGWRAGADEFTPDYCQPVECQQPVGIQHFLFEAATTFPILLGKKVNGNCDLGYELAGGDLVRSCVVDVSNNGVGMLTGSVPVCSPIQCTDPGIPVDGQRNTTARTYTDVIQYECNSGFLLNGTSIIQCQANATWTAPTPHCTGM